MPSPAATSQTILELAKENHIPIDFSCGDGECGTCLVRVIHTNKHQANSAIRSPSAKSRCCRDLGKITKAQIEQMAVNDSVPPNGGWPARWCCDDEDILVEYPSS